MFKRNVRDLALNARINWEVPWKQIPVDQKASLFEVVRPFCSAVISDTYSSHLGSHEAPVPRQIRERQGD